MSKPSRAVNPVSNALAARTVDPDKFENVLQLGGIRTGTLDAPAGSGRSVRVALVDTGAGFRFTVALDRGGDIVDAHYNDVGLAYLSRNGLRPPSHAFHVENEWLANWPGGLVTTCGPEFIGGSRLESGIRTTLHGRYSNTPAALERLINPDPARGQFDMELGLIVRDSRVFGQLFEIRRTLRATLGKPEVTIEDEVTNRDDTPHAHHWLYHCNLGYPLLDENVRFIYRGRAQYWVVPPPPGQDIVQPLPAAEMNALKHVPPALREHAGAGERGLIVETEAEADGRCRIGLINESLPLGIELIYPRAALPRLAHWQHYGPRGSYASALEPFHGSLLGSARDSHPLTTSLLEPGESRTYQLTLRVLPTRESWGPLVAADGAISSHRS